jgi:twitching motility protein PilU
MADIHALLKLMVEQGGSDLFLTYGAAPHLKVQGVTRGIKLAALQHGEVKSIVYGLMTERQQASFEETLEANLSFSIEQVGRFRMNVFLQRGEVCAVIRLIKSEIPSFEQLGLPPQCPGLALLKRGLVLFVGAAGAGKSTSLAAMIGYRAAHADGHILTIEDPIEFQFNHGLSLVSQREVAIDTRSFGNALRNAMREAPDVIMIGEIRDRETAQHAIAYAETGLLCMSTMHANNANQAIDRIINFFPEPMQKQILLDLSMNLAAVISQRLVPAISGQQALATEVLTLTAYVSDLIQRGRIDDIRDAMSKGAESGMRTFDQSLYELYTSGRIELDVALRNADSRTDLALRIRLSERQAAGATPQLLATETAESRRTRR